MRCYNSPFHITTVSDEVLWCSTCWHRFHTGGGFGRSPTVQLQQPLLHIRQLFRVRPSGRHALPAGRTKFFGQPGYICKCICPMKGTIVSITNHIVSIQISSYNNKTMLFVGDRRCATRGPSLACTASPYLARQRARTLCITGSRVGQARGLPQQRRLTDHPSPSPKRDALWWT